MRRSAVSLVAALLAAACVHTSESVLTSEYKNRPVPRDDVQVLLPSDSVPHDCTRVALIYAKGNYSSVSNGKMVNKLREKAGELGANAVELGTVKEPSTGSKIAHAFLFVSADKKEQEIALYCPEYVKHSAPADSSSDRF